MEAEENHVWIELVEGSVDVQAIAGIVKTPDTMDVCGFIVVFVDGIGQNAQAGDFRFSGERFDQVEPVLTEAT